MLWTQVAFMLVKTVFMNADGLIALTFQFPLTNKERTLAFLAFECAAVLAVSSVGSLTLTIVSIITIGPDALPLIATGLLLPVVLTYLAMNLAYMGLERLLIRVRLGRVRGPLLLLGMFAITLTYAAQVQHLTIAQAAAFNDGMHPFVWVNAAQWFAAEHGFSAAAIAGSVAVALLVALSMVAAPSRHVGSARFEPIPLGALGSTPLGQHLAYLLRSSHTITAVSVAAMAVAFLTYRPVLNPCCALAPLCLACLYHYAATSALRQTAGPRRSAFQTYRHLLVPQLILLAAGAALAVRITVLAHPGQVPGIPMALGNCALGAMLTTWIGIAFPAHEDNPFSVFVDLGLASVFITFLALAVGLLHLSTPAIAALIVLSAGALAYFSVDGINQLERKYRHEEVCRQSTHRSHWGDRRDSRRRSHLDSHSHVPDNRKLHSS